jgi:hypothetical protein
MRRPLRFLTLLALSAWAGCAPEGPTAFVTFNIPPSATCVYSPTETDVFIPTGRYDISGAVRASKPNTPTTCAHPYFMHLLVNSFLRANTDSTLGRAEPNILQLDRAEVHLMDLQKRTILFGGTGGSEQLFNPFLVTTNNSLSPASSSTAASVGIASIEAIPVAYAPYLAGAFVGQQILAEVQIFGTTTGDVDIDFKPFVYPIEICDGCLRRCFMDDLQMDRERVTDDEICDDNAGADGRFCVDDAC